MPPDDDIGAAGIHDAGNSADGSSATGNSAADIGAADISAAGIRAIDRLRSAVEWESYAPAGAVGPADLAADTSRIIGDLRDASSRPRRIRAMMLPPSIWGRIFPLSGREE
jgi:hypothetical protein